MLAMLDGGGVRRDRYHHAPPTLCARERIRERRGRHRDVRPSQVLRQEDGRHAVSRAGNKAADQLIQWHKNGVITNANIYAPIGQHA